MLACRGSPARPATSHTAPARPRRRSPASCAVRRSIAERRACSRNARDCAY